VLVSIATRRDISCRCVSPCPRPKMCAILLDICGRPEFRPSINVHLVAPDDGAAAKMYTWSRLSSYPRTLGRAPILIHVHLVAHQRTLGRDRPRISAGFQRTLGRSNLYIPITFPLLVGSFLWITWTTEKPEHMAHVQGAFRGRKHGTVVLTVPGSGKCLS
jgi:hypothetical protein